MAERSEKHSRVGAYLDSAGLDGVVLTRRCNFSWYTCGAHNHVCEAADAGVASLVVTHEGAVVVANNIEATRLSGEDLGADVPVLEYPYYDGEARRAAFARATGAGRFAADVPVEGLDLEPLPADFDRLRWQLSPDEIERYRRICADVAESAESAARLAVPGATEAELAGRLALELRSRSCSPWVLLVGCDQRIALHRHPLPTGKRLQRYALLVTTAERGGLLAAVSRLVAFGKVPAELARRHQAVVTVDAALIAATCPEATLGEIFDAARQAYAEVGFPDQWRHHHQGGSIGYLPREVKAGPDCPVRALDRQAFAWNPSIAGTKSEDTILCRPGGCEVLTHTGQWPCVTGTWQGRSFSRPDILVL